MGIPTGEAMTVMVSTKPAIMTAKPMTAATKPPGHFDDQAKKSPQKALNGQRNQGACCFVCVFMLLYLI